MSLDEPTFDDALDLHRSGRLPEAAQAYRAVIAQTPNDADAFNLLSVVELALGNVNSARELIGQAIAITATDERYHLNAALVFRALNMFDDAISSLQRALAIQPQYYEAWMNLGQMFAHLNRPKDAAAAFRQAADLRPTDTFIWHQLGILALSMQQFEQARQDFTRSINLPGYTTGTILNRGIALHCMQQYGAAIADFGTVTRLEPNNAEAHYRIGLSLSAMNRFELALLAFDETLALDDQYPGAHRERGHTLAKLRRLIDATQSYKSALVQMPSDYEAWNGLGLTFLDLSQYPNALHAFDQAIQLAPQLPEPRYNRGQTLVELGQFSQATADFTNLLESGHEIPFLLGQRFAAQLHACDWANYAERRDEIAKRCSDGKAVDTPFNFLIHNTSGPLQLKATRAFVATTMHPANAKRTQGRRSGDGRIRLAYLSADFNNHATAHLAAGLFERHDRQKFEVVAISFSVDDKSAMRERVVKSFDKFIDVSAMSDHEVARVISELGIHIAVDLKGHSAQSRPGVLATRPAPVQMQFLGFPATMGVDYIDYFIADHVTVPMNHESHFSEKIIRLPGSYQVNDISRPEPGPTPTRLECGLPRTGIVFCSFNNAFKITPDVFSIWMQLLGQVPGSVLWLLAPSEECRSNLRREAQTRGIDPNRLVFAPRKEIADHLARHILADIFLDTLPCNAHTTASDALWMGVPIVTCLGDTFTGRVCASLLHAASLSDFATSDLKSYQALAFALATEPDRLKKAKMRVAEVRTNGTLFDIDAFRNKIEHAYSVAWERHMRGDPPDHLDIANI